MKIGITNDHRGVKVKHFLTEYLTNLGYDVIDYGTDSEEPADFPDYAKKLGLALESTNEFQLPCEFSNRTLVNMVKINHTSNLYPRRIDIIKKEYI